MAMGLLNDMQSLNAHLASRTFLSCRTMSDDDKRALACIESTPALRQIAQSSTQCPHIFRWIRHCRSLGDTACSSGAQVARQQQNVLDRLREVLLLAARCRAALLELQEGSPADLPVAELSRLTHEKRQSPAVRSLAATTANSTAWNGQQPGQSPTPNESNFIEAFESALTKFDSLDTYFATGRLVPEVIHSAHNSS